ncbi:MAG: HlyD family efflux transporter periplasmic adaptor subunit [Salinivirgaceae bacterium]|nr:HlyD family efflux transporter periplasmic adaptor subunit [Salinivirgaceae bacterium]
MNTLKSKRYNCINLIIVVLFASFGSCSNGELSADAYGNFEADELIISAEATGKLLQFEVAQGQKITENEIVALVDTIMPSLQMQEIGAQKSKIVASIANIEAQKQVVIQQKENLLIELKRVENMRESGASTQKQLDDINGQLKVIEQQIIAFNTQKTAIAKELNIVNSKKVLLEEQLIKCRVKNPINGTILEKYAKKGELTAAGKPLYKIADLDKTYLKAYLTGGQLYRVKIGDMVKVRIDKGTNEYLEYDGKITWVSSHAEFTPKIIQTKEERVNMVYAIKVMVKNDGKIKIGMPGEVILK